MGDLYEQIARFRRKYPVRTISSGGTEWEYFAGGRGPETILFFHGGMGNGEMYFEYMLDLEDTFRVVAPSIASGVSSVDDVLNAVTAILDRESVPACHVFGHSQGGYLAMELARRKPERVRTLMISSSTLPSAEQAQKIGKQVRTLRILPEWLLAPATRFAFKRAFRTAGSDVTPAQQLFLLKEIARFSKVAELRKMALSSARLQLDYHAHPSSGREWGGRVLLLEADRDGIVPAEQSAALRARYPEAEVERFAHAGHLDVMLRASEYISRIRKFLAAA